jgi:hypothetical protein
MYKRGQVTVFIILGIIILITTATFFLVKSSMIKEEVTTSEDLVQYSLQQEGALKLFVEGCITETAEQALIRNSYSGTYFNLPKQSTTELYGDLPYFYFNDNQTFPSTETIENELSKFIDSELLFCLDNFSVFQKQGYQINIGEPHTTAVIKENKLIVKTELSIISNQITFSTSYDLFIVEVFSPQFYDDLELSEQFVETIDGEEICLSCLGNLAADNDVFVDIFTVDNDTYVFELTDQDYTINMEKFRLRFAMQYNE